MAEIKCARFLRYLSLLHIRRVHGENPGCTVLGVHPVDAQNKTLISDTDICAIMMQYFRYTDKREVLQQEYSELPIFHSLHFRWVVM